MKNTSIRKSFLVIQGVVGLLLLFLVIQGCTMWRVCKQGSTATAGLKNEGLPSLKYLASLQENLAIYRLHSYELMFAQDKDKPSKMAETDAVKRNNASIIESLNNLYPSGEGHAHIVELQTKLNDYVATMDKIRDSLAKDFEGAMKILDTEVPAKVANLNASAVVVKDYCSQVANARAELTVSSFESIRQSVLWFGTLGILFATIAVGLVTLQSSTVRKSLRGLADKLGTASTQLTDSAQTVSEASQSLAKGASNQAASIEETSASLEEISCMANSNATKLQNANTLAKQARSSAESGASDMNSMSKAMEAIKDSSDDIANIIKTIDEIAFQTNILALNAAVEAARAGSAGLGFAVVADEVRNLAQRSAKAAKETAEKIEGAMQKTAQGVQLNAKVATGLADIVIKVRQLDEIAADVAKASLEQKQGVANISSAVAQMDSVTQSNAASSEESAAAAEELNSQAHLMREAVSELLRLVGEQSKQFSDSTKHLVAEETAANSPNADENGFQNGHSRVTAGNGVYSDQLN